jgi:hypothetical protein
MPESDLQKLNPQIAEIDIGSRNLRKLTIYPLSLKDQIEFTDLIGQAILLFMDKEAERTDIEFITLIIQFIKQNISKLISLATGEDGEKLLEEITNDQVAQIADIIYVVNYEGSIKNFQGLFEKIKVLFPSKRQSLMSASVTRATRSTTSPDDPSKTGD